MSRRFGRLVVVMLVALLVAGLVAAAGAVQASAAEAGAATGQGEAAAAAGDSQSGPAGGSDGEEALELKTPAQRALKGYSRFFSVKRREQVQAAERIFEKPDYHVRYDLLKPVLDQMFRTLRDGQKVLEASGVTGKEAELPLKDEKALEALLKIWENVAFFSDLALRLPDIVHSMVDGHPVRQKLLRYAVDLSLQAPIYSDDSPHREQLLLLMQEMGLAETPDPNYVNPFREAFIHQQTREAKERQRAAQKKAEKLAKRKALRQPHLAGGGQGGEGGRHGKARDEL